MENQKIPSVRKENYCENHKRVNICAGNIVWHLYNINDQNISIQNKNNNDKWKNMKLLETKFGMNLKSDGINIRGRWVRWTTG